MTDQKYPLISVLIPSFNHAHYVEETIRSIWDQDYPNIELVVVDDVSTDRSRELLTRLKAFSPHPFKLLLNEKNMGPVRTVSKAFSNAQGEFIVPFASDDKFLPGAFASRIRIFQEQSDLRILFANGRILFGDGKLGPRLHRNLQKRLLAKSAPEILEFLYTHSSPLFLQTALIKRSFLDECGAYDQEILADDWVVNIRMFQKLTNSRQYRFLDEDVVLYRVHGTNLHRNVERHIALKAQVIEKYTPEYLKRRAKANIYWEIGLSLLGKSPLRALRYLAVSQAMSPRPVVMLATGWEILGIALRKVFSRLKQALGCC